MGLSCLLLAYFHGVLAIVVVFLLLLLLPSVTMIPREV